MASSGTIQSINKTIRKLFIKELLAPTFTNGETFVLTEGQEVYLSGDLTVKKRVSGGQYPIGYVKNANCQPADKLAVVMNISTDLQANAGGSPLVAGQLVKPTGASDVNGLPTYVVANDGEYASAIVMVGAAPANQARLGVLFAPVLILTNS